MYKSWKYKLPPKKWNKNERGIWEIRIGLTEMCFPSSGLEHKLHVKVIFEAALLHYIGHFFGENIFWYIVWSRDNLFGNLKCETLVCKKNCNDVFFLLAGYFNILTFES